jgi:hypothetical protein
MWEVVNSICLTRCLDNSSAIARFVAMLTKGRSPVNVSFPNGTPLHVNPQIGVFLSQQRPAQLPDTPAP